MSSSAFPTKLTKTALFTICGVCWVLQSLPAFLLYMDGQEIVQYKTKVASQLLLPQLLICNRFPFTQAGLSSFGQQFQRDSVLSYLRQWLDPSLSASPPEDPFSTPLTETDRQQAEQIIAQLLPNGRLKQRLEQLMPQCQDMISSCVVGSRQLGGFDCCRMVQPWLATPRAGICWPFVGNLSSIQSPLDYPRGLQITFQISRNSYLSSSLTVHPGLDLYLIPPEMHNRLRVATSIGDPFPLNDKRTLRMDIRKEIHKHNELINFCLSSAEHVQPKQMVPSASGGLICMMDKAIRKCSCVPMLIVLWTLQNDLDSTFLRQFNASTICTVGEFDQCIRPYIEFAMPQGWTEYTVPENGPKELKDALEECKKSSFIPCQNIQFNSRTNERDLPAEYRNTQDFVSRLSLSFDSFLVKEVTVAKQMDLYQLLSTFGINLWWFAIGHLIWSICRFRCFGPHYSSSNLKGGNRIDPKSPMIPAASSSVGVVLGPAHNPSISSQPVNNGGGQQFEPNFPNQIQNNQTLGLGGGGARQLPPLAIPNQNLMGNGTMVEGPAMDRQIEVEEEEPAGR